MEFDWTTFILEILNFLVLLWILQRLIYRPVLAMLDARQQRIRAQIDQAEQLRAEAEALRQHYQAQLADWQREREHARDALEAELAQLRDQAEEDLKQIQADDEAKQRVRNEAFIASRQAILIREAVGTAYRQVSALLQRLASPQLTETITEMFLEDLRQLSDEQQASLRKAAVALMAGTSVEIVCAHPLTAAAQSALTETLAASAGTALSFTIREDSSLIAGLRVVVGECQLHANLADELAFFRQQHDHG